MIKSKVQIISDIESYIKNRGGNPRDFYVGITGNPNRRLAQHGVTNADKPIVCQASSSNVARDVEEHFIENKKTRGGGGGGKPTSCFVYAYKTAHHTNP